MPLQQITFPLRGEFITLDRLLKACGLAESGGRAKTMGTMQPAESASAITGIRNDGYFSEME